MKTINIEETILQDLQNRYKKSVLNKKELAHELGMSVGAISNYICKGYGCPRFIKAGPAKNAPVLFPLIEVANYLSEVMEVA
ncbi:MAG: hypothetical protein L3J10_05080 [Sulfurimonas sp.]|nr:hypothetical protein [Sulfurimonas sp.]